MANNPEYVRLSDRNARGIVVDMVTGWSISGFDVREFPEDREQARFVRQKINAGVLEPATAAEFEAIQDTGDEDDEDARQAADFVKAVQAATRKNPQQEHVLREKEGARAQRVANARLRARLEEEGYDPDEFDEDSANVDLNYASDRARRQKVIDSQQEDELTEDDPEAQKERSATRPAKKAAKKAAGARKRQAASEGEGENQE